ncbi:MAG: ABC transporter permease [Planctomycetota bacterium]|jgi:ABC-type transport system involved in multi-copper enzyme maturation permease subunit
MRLNPDHFWTYSEWLFQQGALFNGVLLAIILSVLGFLFGYIVSVFKHGPSEGFLKVSQIIGQLFTVDLPKMSPRRIYAVAKLAVKESIRKKVLVLVGIFVVGMMFAGWYLDPNAEYPARLYISFVLTATTYLVLLMALFISCFSIPADIKSRTIYTITTKPVRPLELFLGRVFGFTAIGTFVLAIMGLLSYIFVVRGLDHDHEVVSLDPTGRSGETSFDTRHRHTFTLNAEGRGTTNEVKGHRHIVTKVGDKAVVGGPIDDLTARIPIYARGLSFTGRDGEKNEGYNVGYMSEYQKYIEGDSLSRAVWRFEGVDKTLFKDVILYDLTISAFRTYKGDIVTPVGGLIHFRSTDGRVKSEDEPFKVKEFQVDRRSVRTKLKGFIEDKPADLDFFNDIAADGSFEVVIRCQDRGQYLGMAAADIYLRPADLQFWWNFVKGYISIWLQMFIVICFGTMFSTFLSGPVAVIATVAALILGFFGFFVDDLVKNTSKGGGPIESLIRLPTQMGSQIELELGNEKLQSAIFMLDRGLVTAVSRLKDAVPNFSQLDTSNFVAYGYNIFGGLLGRHLTIAFCYFVLTALVSYFFLKTREMAA